MAENNQPLTLQTIEQKESGRCPFETDSITCDFCDGVVNVYQAGPGLTEVHCDECGAHYIKSH